MQASVLGIPLLYITPEGAFGSLCKAPATSAVPSPLSLYVYVPEVDDFYKKALAAGGHSLLAPHDAFWGDRMCKLRDPDGYEWSFATHNADAYAQHKQETRGSN